MSASQPSQSAAGGRITVDLGALVQNWKTVASHAAGAETAAVLKADGYGVGLVRTGAALASAGCRTFFVALPQEGELLRGVLPDVTIYVLDGLLPDAASEYMAASLRPVLGSPAEIAEWTGAGGEPCAIHVDTGMHRLGLSSSEARRLAGDAAMAQAPAVKLVLSHLACADTPAHPLNARQLGAFREARKLFPGIPASLANSAGVFLGPDYHFEMVRPGIALYGARFLDNREPLRPVVTVEARVLQVRDAASGETIGYGAAHTFKAQARVAILAAGYADGYHRAASPAGRPTGPRVWIAGRHVPIVGRVSMDLIAVDVTGAPGVQRGDWAELFGANVPVDEAASHAGTIGYELLTALGSRYERRYVGGP